MAFAFSAAQASSFEAFQVVAAARRAQVRLTPGTGPGEAVPCLRHNATKIFGISAIARYLAALSDPQRLLTTEEDRWIEWEETVLRAAVTAENRWGVEEALSHLEAGLAGSEPGLSSLPGPLHELLAVGVAAGLALLGEAFTAEAKTQEFAAPVSAEKLEADVAPYFPKKMSVSASLETIVTEIMQGGLDGAFPAMQGSGSVQAAVTRAKGAAHGDYQCMNAMRIFKELKAAGAEVKSGREVAEQIVAAVPGNGAIETLEVAGPGFINIRLRSDFIVEMLGAQLKAEGPQPPSAQRQKILVDFSSPNIAKEMHVGHLRSTIIGDTICRLLEFCGHAVLRVNHVGDWGTQFGMLIKHLLDTYPDLRTSPPDISDLTALYKAAKQRFEDDEDFKTAAREHVVRLQAGDPECREVWELLCDISRKEFDKVYARLDIRLEEVGESFYNPLIPAVVEELEKLGIAELYEGATVIFQKPTFEIPLIIRKSDGGFGYDSTDMAALSHRLRTLSCQRVIYVTDAGQAQHFHMCFGAATKAGWAGEGGAQLEHVGFGVVQGEDGKRFKTRSGETVKLVDLLDEAVERFGRGLRERVSEGKCDLSEGEVVEAASKVGYSAVKYFDLKQDPATDYQFSYDRMLDPRGDTAVYLCYAYARLCSIMRKALATLSLNAADLAARMGAAAGAGVLLPTGPERALAFELLQLDDVIARTAADLHTHRLCDYLHTLCTVYTDFVTQCHVLNAGETALVESRLVLCKATGDAMKVCFRLLGMTPLEKM